MPTLQKQPRVAQGVETKVPETVDPDGNEPQPVITETPENTEDCVFDGACHDAIVGPVGQEQSAISSVIHDILDSDCGAGFGYAAICPRVSTDKLVAHSTPLLFPPFNTHPVLE